MYYETPVTACRREGRRGLWITLDADCAEPSGCLGALGVGNLYSIGVLGVAPTLWMIWDEIGDGTYLLTFFAALRDAIRATIRAGKRRRVIRNHPFDLSILLILSQDISPTR